MILVDNIYNNMRTSKEIDQIRECWLSGFKQMETSIKLNIPRATVKDYYNRFSKGEMMEPKPSSLLENLLLVDSKKEAYAYLLGLYLGDGHIVKTKPLKNGNAVYKFRIFQDAKYTNLIQLCIDKMKILFESEVNIINKPGCKEIFCYKNNIPEIFPQHGPGKKHTREIVLQAWQKDIVRIYPKDFLKGLIHSDGCRYLSVPGNIDSIKYEFKNTSSDILGYFDWACSLLDVDTRRHSCGKASILRTKKDVNIFESFIGPKT
jgi:hypothetical protein